MILLCGVHTLADVVTTLVTDREPIGVKVFCGISHYTGPIAQRPPKALEVIDNEDYYHIALQIARLMTFYGEQGYLTFQANGAGSIFFTLDGYVVKHQAAQTPNKVWGNTRPYQLLMALCAAGFGSVGITIGRIATLRFFFDSEGVLDEVVIIDDGGC